MQGVLAMDEHNNEYEELIEVPVEELGYARIRKEFLAFMNERTQLPIGQTNEDRYQAILEIILGGAASKERIKDWRKATIEFLEHIHENYQDDVVFAPIINALDGQLRLLDLDEQLIDNPLDTELWDQAEALYNELITSNAHHRRVACAFTTLKKAAQDARPKILAGRIVAQDCRDSLAVRNVENERLLQELLSHDSSMRLCPTHGCSFAFATPATGILERLNVRMFGGLEFRCPSCDQEYSVDKAIDYAESWSCSIQ